MAQFSRDRLALLRAVLAEKGLAAPRAGALPRRAERARAPLSSAQERLFFLELYEPGTALYNDAVLVTLAGALEPARLARAVARVAERHELLRTSFVLGAQGPEQRIAQRPGEHAAPELRVLPRVDGLTGARALARAEAREPFELEHPPWRIALAPLGGEGWALVLTMHHILSDGASMGLFLDELAAFHAGDGGDCAALAPLAVQFGDFAAWERGQHDEARARADRAYWQSVLGRELAPLHWSTGAGPASRRGAQTPLELDAPTLAALTALARSAQVTPSQVLLAAWFVLLARESGAHELCTGIASSLRTRRELEPLLGFFVQSLPLRVSLADDPEFPALLARVRVAAFEAQAHAALPFEEILRCAQRAGSAGTPPPPQTFFSHMKDAIRAPSLAGLESCWEFVDAGVARFELALVLHESGLGVTGFLEHDLGLFPPAAGARLAADYVALVGALLAQPAQRLSALVGPARRAAPRERRAPFPAPTPGPAPSSAAPLPPPRLRRAAGDGT